MGAGPRDASDRRGCVRFTSHTARAALVIAHVPSGPAVVGPAVVGPAVGLGRAASRRLGRLGRLRRRPTGGSGSRGGGCGCGRPGSRGGQEARAEDGVPEEAPEAAGRRRSSISHHHVCQR
jgi:hypothetical protein